jgi:hypothetical protein
MKRQNTIYSMFFASVMISSLLLSIFLVPFQSTDFSPTTSNQLEFSESIDFHKKFISESTERDQQPYEKGYEQDESEEIGEKEDLETKSFHHFHADLIQNLCRSSKLKQKVTNQIADYKQSIRLPFYILYQSSKLDFC